MLLPVECRTCPSESGWGLSRDHVPENCVLPDFSGQPRGVQLVKAAMRVLVSEYGDDCFGIDSWASGRTTGEAGAVFSILGVITRCVCDYAGTNGLDDAAVSPSEGLFS